jgi:hypothetical protein
METGYIRDGELNTFVECYTSKHGNLVTGIVFASWSLNTSAGQGYWKIYHSENSSAQKIASSVSWWALRKAPWSNGVDFTLHDGTTIRLIKFENEEVRD